MAVPMETTETVQANLSRPSPGASDHRRGAVLGVVLIVLLIFSLLGFQLVELSAKDGEETARAANSSQAFWLAEAGLHHARAMLRSSSAFRAAPWTLTGNGMAYTANTIVAPDGITFTISSTGTVQTAVRGVQQTLQAEEGFPAAFDYVLFGGGGDMTIRKDATITGDVFQDGDVTFFQPPAMTGTLYATGTVDGSPSTEPPDPPPTMPALDTSYYDALIAYAATNGGGSRTYPLALGGATLYVMGNESIGDITGPGTLVVGGDASLGQNVILGDNTWVISGGTFSIDKNLQAGSNCLLYAAIGFDIAKSADVSIGNCTLITPGDIDVKKNLTMSGLLYAGGTITMEKDTTLVGSAVAGQGFDISKLPNLTYDASQFPPFLPPGFTPEVSVVNILWKEQL